jgi:hypothetical protein
MDRSRLAHEETQRPMVGSQRGADDGQSLVCKQARQRPEKGSQRGVAAGQFVSDRHETQWPAELQTGPAAELEAQAVGKSSPHSTQ